MTTETAREPRLIKRYANRKMYDTERSCYITLEEVSQMVRAGEDVKVIDNKTKDDLTEVTLTQALLDSKRKKRSGVSLVELRKMIASGSDFIQRSIGEPVSRAQRDAERTVEKWRTEAERTVDRVLQRSEGEDGEEVVVPAPPEATTPEEAAFDSRVSALFAHLAADARKELGAQNKELRQRVSALEARIEALESAGQSNGAASDDASD
ncbi:MAG: polyhydroxyalkanoate synthesis regulator DNA-binding domain-containing protein [Myxococcales bacterium]|nr:polyhydroxyalkanoate synthesis regulator DNA-binding domain-containing protein [Myxococcales bacterium]